jgi:hypothetical protein
MRYPLLIAAILIIMVLAAGCSDQSGSGTATPVPTTTPVQPKFIAGDIVAKTATSSDTYWLIIKYDAKTDKYERAFVFRSLQETWYRKDNKTELADRSPTEKVYPAKIFHVETISRIPFITSAPTSAVTTTLSGPAPQITSILPNSGPSGSSVSIQNLAGKNFQSGATVKLIGTGTTPIIATAVNAIDTKITCVFNLAGAIAGKYDVMVTNPNGQSVTVFSGFTINEPGPVITKIDPSVGSVGDMLTLTITGSNFKTPSFVVFNKGTTDIKADSVQINSATQITCKLWIPQGTATGPWNVIVQSIIDKQNGTAMNKFTINNAT